MLILLVTDAWTPQVNGVVRTWGCVRQELEQMGHRLHVIHPGLFRTVGAPRYPEIRLALLPWRRLASMIDEHRPDTIHIATEGPLGSAARRLCLRRGWPFTTSYHTQFPQYLRRYYGLPTRWTYRFVRRFHGSAAATLVPTAAVARELHAQGLDNLVVWSRGVDTAMFNGDNPKVYDLPRPIFLCAGRVALEKNIEAFLALDLPGSKVVVGDGPARADLQKRYPAAHFVGYQFDADLAAHYAGADALVFPSRTDTFGVVMLEAGACGLPIAAYPVTGPIDVVIPGVTGVLREDLRDACLEALKLDRDTCVRHARQNSWRRCAQIFLDHVAPIQSPRRELAAVEA